MSASPIKPEPFRIEPIFSERLWGSRSLAPLFPEMHDLKSPIGEAWLTGIDCKVANGAFSGRTLGEAWREMPAEWRGTRFAQARDFPILVKFIFPKDKLSIQVHPDDAYASVHEKATGGRGKTEMWHIVSAEPGAQVLIGLKPGVNKEKFLAALESQTVEQLLEGYPVHEGDTFFLPACTPHTIGPGMVLCEVQEYSDLTYRVYDYGRVDAKGKPRQLHIEQALAVIDFAGTKGGKTRPLQWSCAELANSLVTACPYFSAERWDVSGLIPVIRDLDTVHLSIFLSGTGGLRWAGGRASYQPGECWFMPACLDSYEVIPFAETSLIRAYVPEIAKLRKSFQELGISESALTKIVFE